MNFLTSPRAFIDLRLADLVQADTRFGQVARFRRLVHEQDAAGVCSVQIETQILVYCLVGQELGERLPDTRFVTLSVNLKGNNHTLVEAATGKILAIRDVPENAGSPVTPGTADAAEWGELCRSYDQGAMLQGDWFETVRDTQPVPIGAWILVNMQQAARMGRFSQP